MKNQDHVISVNLINILSMVLLLLDALVVVFLITRKKRIHYSKEIDNQIGW